MAQGYSRTGLELKALNVAILEARVKNLVIAQNLVRIWFAKKQNIDLMFKDMHTQKCMFSKVQFILYWCFDLFGLDRCSTFSQKLMSQFRTCISLPIHVFRLQNPHKVFYKIFFIFKTDLGIGFGLVWLIGQSTMPISGQNNRPHSPPNWQGVCMFGAHSRSIDVSTDCHHFGLG